MCFTLQNMNLRQLLMCLQWSSILVRNGRKGWGGGGGMDGVHGGWGGGGGGCGGGDGGWNGGEYNISLGNN